MLIKYLSEIGIAVLYNMVYNAFPINVRLKWFLIKKLLKWPSFANFSSKNRTKRVNLVKILYTKDVIYFDNSYFSHNISNEYFFNFSQMNASTTCVKKRSNSTGQKNIRLQICLLFQQRGRGSLNVWIGLGFEFKGWIITQENVVSPTVMKPKIKGYPAARKPF